MNRKLVASSAIASVFALGLTVAETASAGKEGFEKCYGVAMAGQNDCAAADGSHSCAGQSTADAAGGEWVYLPEGTCSKVVGGSIEPKT